MLGYSAERVVGSRRIKAKGHRVSAFCELAANPAVGMPLSGCVEKLEFRYPEPSLPTSSRWRYVIVNLTEERPAKDAIRRYISCSGNFRPQAHRRRAQFPMVAGGDVEAWDVEQVGNRVMDGDEAL